jgi:hypothetical protein
VSSQSSCFRLALHELARTSKNDSLPSKLVSFSLGFRVGKLLIIMGMKDVTRILNLVEHGVPRRLRIGLPSFFVGLTQKRTRTQHFFKHRRTDLGICPVMAFARGPKANDRKAVAERLKTFLREFVARYRMNI